MVLLIAYFSQSILLHIVDIMHLGILLLVMDSEYESILDLYIGGIGNHYPCIVQGQVIFRCLEVFILGIHLGCSQCNI